ncbi:MAG: DUF4258 domain-containing protein [Defluviitaleaceae bacterium]|nr:DUF4258 domain-containing protein [Defluviitaleaceae bacterium]
MFDIDSVKALYKGSAVKYTRHFKNRVEEHGISKAEIAHVLLSGEIIEQYPNDEPLPSILIFGYTKNKKPLHIAVSLDDAVIWLVTAYVPTLNLWETEYKTRKAGDGNEMFLLQG